MTIVSRDRLAWLDGELQKLDDNGLLRTLPQRGGPQRAHISLDGRQFIHFGSNDYLALASDERLASAAARAAREEGWGGGASPLLGGRSASMAALEKALAEFEGTESALVFSSGSAANAGTIAALVDRQDAIYADAKNHASLIDGARLSRAEIHVYRHCDAEHLQSFLEGAGRYRRRLIVTDSLFSMDGDLAPLGELADLADRYDAMLMVDEAHATGVFGAQGRGVAEHLGVESCIDIRAGTLSKALGSSGGFICGSRTLIDWLVNRARTYVFSTAPPAGVAAAALEALRIVATEPERRSTLLRRAAEARDALHHRGWHTGRSASQIIPIIVGHVPRAMELATTLRARGFFVPAIRPPSVPVGEALLRVSVTYGHARDMIDGLAAALGPAE